MKILGVYTHMSLIAIAAWNSISFFFRQLSNQVIDAPAAKAGDSWFNEIALNLKGSTRYFDPLAR